MATDNGQLVLDEPSRVKLDGIVSKMEANKESEDDIRFVVNDFKSKYGKEDKEPSDEPPVPAVPLNEKDAQGVEPQPNVPSGDFTPSVSDEPSAKPSATTDLGQGKPKELGAWADILSSPAKAAYEGIAGGGAEVVKAAKGFVAPTSIEGAKTDLTSSLQIAEGLAKTTIGGMNLFVPEVAAFTGGVTAVEEGLKTLADPRIDFVAGKEVKPEEYIQYLTSPFTKTFDPQSELGQVVAGLGDLILPMAIGLVGKGKPELKAKIDKGEPLTPTEIRDAQGAIISATPKDIQDVSRQMVVDQLHPDIAHIKDKELKLYQDAQNIVPIMGDAGLNLFAPDIEKTQADFKQQTINLQDKNKLEQAAQVVGSDEGKSLIEKLRKDNQAAIDKLKPDVQEPVAEPDKAINSRGSETKASGEDGVTANEEKKVTEDKAAPEAATLETEGNQTTINKNGEKVKEVGKADEGKKEVIPSEVSGESKVKPQTSENEAVKKLTEQAKKHDSVESFIDTITNDEGGIGKHIEYSPFKRYVETDINNTPLTDFGFAPEEKVTIYRGVDNASQKNISAGDYIATSKELAKSYTGGKVISKEVPASHVRFSSKDGISQDAFKKGFNQTHYEGVYNPEPLIPVSELERIWKNAKDGGKLAEAKTIATQHGYEHPTKMLNSIEKNTGERFMSVQDATKSESPKVKEFLKGKKEKLPISTTVTFEKKEGRGMSKKPFKSDGKIVAHEVDSDGNLLYDVRHELKGKTTSTLVKPSEIIKSDVKELSTKDSKKTVPQKENGGTEIASDNKFSLSEIKSKVIEKAPEAKASAKKEGVSLKVQKNDLLSQINRARLAIQNDLLLPQEDIVKKLQDEGFEVVTHGETGKAQVVFDVEGDGQFRLAADGLDIAYDEIKKHWSTDENPVNKVRGAKSRLPDRSANASLPYKLSDAENDLVNAKENLATAQKSGNKDLIDFYTKDIDISTQHIQDVKNAQSMPLDEFIKSYDGDERIGKYVWEGVREAIKEEKKSTSLEDKIDRANALKQKKAEANAQIGEAIDNIFKKIGNVKNLLPEEKTQLIDDLKNVFEGIVKKGLVTIEEAIESAKNYIKEKYGDKVTDKEIDDIVEGAQEKPFEKESGKKSLAGRVYEGKTPEEIKASVEKHGLNYEVETHIEAERIATNFVKDVGIDNALKAVRDNEVKGGAASFVWASAIDAVHKEFLLEKDATKKAELAEKEASLIDEFDDRSRTSGQFISALNAVYQVSDLGYKLGSIINRALRANEGQKIPEILKNRLTDLSTKLDEVNKKIAELEEKQKEQPPPEIIREEPREKKIRQSLSPEKLSRKQELAKKYRGTLNDITRVITLFAEKDFMEYASLVLEEAGGDFKIWAREMINNVGKHIADHLPKLYKELGGKQTPYLDEYKGRLKKQIAEYERKLREKDFSPKGKKELPPADQEAFDLLVEKNRLKDEIDTEIEKLKLKNRPLSEKVTEGFVDVLNIPRAMMASADLSAPLRQGAILSIKHPMVAARTFKEMLRHAFSEKNATKWLTELKSTPEYEIIKKAGLYITEPTSKISAKEEQFMSNIAHKIPVWGRVIKGSERAYVGYLNKLRVDVFTQFHDALVREGFEGKKLNKELESYASFLNNASGRGSLGRFEESAAVLNATFFSPRYAVSRFNLLNPYTYVKMSPKARVEALKTMGVYIGVVSSTLAIAQAAGASVNLNPTSPDFGKIRVGQTRFDVMSGMQQWIRLISQIVSGKKTNIYGDEKILGEKKYSDTRLTVATRFLRSKLSPSTGFLVNLMEGKDYIGKPLTFKFNDLRSFSNTEEGKMLIPLYMQDLADAATANGVGKVSTAAALSSFFGVGVQTYPAPEDKGMFSSPQGGLSQSDNKAIKKAEKEAEKYK